MAMLTENMSFGGSVLDCLRALCREVELIAGGMLFEDSASDEDRQFLRRLRVYEQDLPVLTAEHKDVDGTTDYIDEQAEDPILNVPWCCVKISSWVRGMQSRDDFGNVQPVGKGNDYRRRVIFALAFGLKDSRRDAVAHRGLLNLMDLVEARFESDPVLDSRYLNDGRFSMELSDVDVYPYAFGTVTTGFYIPGMGRTKSKFV